MATVVIPQQQRLSLKEELEMHGIFVMEPDEVRRIKQDMCGSTLFWLISCVPGTVLRVCANVSLLLLILSVVAWVGLACQFVVAACWWLVSDSFIGHWPSSTGWIVLATITISTFVLVAISDSPRFTMWRRTPYNTGGSPKRFSMPRRAVQAAEHIKESIPDAKIDIIYEEKDPFLRIRRGWWEHCYVEHWLISYGH